MTEVLHRLGDRLSKETDRDTAEGDTSVLEVEVDLRGVRKEGRE